MSRDSLIARSTCYKQSNAFLQRRRKAKRSFPMERGPTAKHHPAWNPQCTQWFRAEEFPLLCPTPRVMSRFSLGDVGEARCPLSHRWTDTSPILPDASRGVALCVEPPLGVRPTLPASRGSSQLVASAEESLVTGAERSNRRVTCLLHMISDGTRVRHAQGITLSILRAFIACAATVQTSLHLAETLRPTALPHDSALHL